MDIVNEKSGWKNENQKRAACHAEIAQMTDLHSHGKGTEGNKKIAVQKEIRYVSQECFHAANLAQFIKNWIFILGIYSSIRLRYALAICCNLFCHSPLKRCISHNEMHHSLKSVFWYLKESYICKIDSMIFWFFSCFFQISPELGIPNWFNICNFELWFVK